MYEIVNTTSMRISASDTCWECTEQENLFCQPTYARKCTFDVSNLQFCLWFWLMVFFLANYSHVKVGSKNDLWLNFEQNKLSPKPVCKSYPYNFLVSRGITRVGKCKFFLYIKLLQGIAIIIGYGSVKFFAHKHFAIGYAKNFVLP